jgi:fructose-bisphosphate aldolase class II
MLCTLNEVLPRARKDHYAVVAFDFYNDLFVRAILEACEEKRAPAILAALPGDLEGRGMDYMAAVAKGVAPSYSIPAVLHLDHAKSFDLIKRAIGAGFGSVMLDGSDLPFHDNIEATREVAAYAHARGVTVEAELGSVAGADLEGNDQGPSLLTDPKDVAEFVEKTGVDALAVSIGTAHGVYKSKPVLDIKLLGEIAAVVDIPLVLHGGSGTPDDQLRDAIRNGITKLNVYADIRIALNSGFGAAAGLAARRADELPGKMFEPIAQSLRKEVLKKISLSMSDNRY